MAVNEKFEIQGLSELLTELEKVASIDKVEMGKSIVPSVQMMVDAIKVNAPTEDIRNSIAYVNNPSTYPLHFYVAPLQSRKGNRKGQLAHIFEYGTVDRNTRKGENRGSVKPTFFFRNAVDANSEKVATRLTADLMKFVENKINKK